MPGFTVMLKGDRDFADPGSTKYVDPGTPLTWQNHGHLCESTTALTKTFFFYFFFFTFIGCAFYCGLGLC